ncbi:MAG TPA: DNA-binding protein [Thermoanaerobaculia bacterium]|jgi:hypothetical protein
MKPALSPSTAYFQAHGLAVEAEQLEAMVKLAITQLQQTLYPPEPLADLTQAEAEALTAGGLDLSPRRDDEASALAQTTAKYAALLTTSLTTAEAAERLGVDASRIRQRLTERTLYGVRTSEGWRLPAFQFLAESLLPAIGDVLPLLSPDLHPVAVHNFFTLPNVDLREEELGRDLSPREWLQAGYPPNAVADLAAALE